MATNGAAGYVYNTGGCGFTCARTGLAPGVGTVSRANQLGFIQRRLKTAAAPAAPAAPAADGCCNGVGACLSCCEPFAYETPVLCGFVGSISGVDYQRQDVVVQARLVRATTSPSGFTYAIGCAVNASSGELVGVLTVLGPGPAPVSGAPPAPVLPSVALETLLPSGLLLRLTAPRAIIARGPGLVTVVGTGTVGTPANFVLYDEHPMLCHICVNGAALGPPQCVAGNGSTELTVGTSDTPATIVGEDYYDVVANPCDPNSLYVCGLVALAVGEDEPLRTAVVRAVNVDGVSTAASVLAGDPGGDSLPGFDVSVAVSMVLQPALGLLTIGVNGTLPGDATPQACLWSVASRGLGPVAPGPAPATAIHTLYNAPDTGLLPFGGQPLAAVTIVRVVASPTGAVFVVARVDLQTPLPEDTADQLLPVVAVGLWAFGPTTAPDKGFGADGVAVWAVPDGGATVGSFPTDALLTADSSKLVVVGNAFPSGGGVTPPPPTGVAYPSLPQLDTLESGVGAAINAADPCGFVAVAHVGLCGGDSGVAAAGGPCGQEDPGTCGPARPLITTVVSCLPGCAGARLVAAVAPSGPLGVRVTGDVFRRVGCPLQPAGALDVGVAVTSPCMRVTNASLGTWVGASPGSALAAPPDGGPLRVDYCAPAASTLLVAGPVVIGGPCGAATADRPFLQPPLAVPGTLYFDATSAAFYGCRQAGLFEELLFAGP